MLCAFLSLTLSGTRSYSVRVLPAYDSQCTIMNTGYVKTFSSSLYTSKGLKSLLNLCPFVKNAVSVRTSFTKTFFSPTKFIPSSLASPTSSHLPFPASLRSQRIPHALASSLILPSSHATPTTIEFRPHEFYKSAAVLSASGSPNACSEPMSPSGMFWIVMKTR